MVKHDILGEMIWECSEEEARQIWKDSPEDRWRIWTHDEITAHIMDDPDQLAECIQRKKDKPGRLS